MSPSQKPRKSPVQHNLVSLSITALIVLSIIIQNGSHDNKVYAIKSPSQSSEAEKFPFLSYNISSSYLDKDTFIEEGIVLSQEFNGSAVDFIPWPWEQTPRNLNLTRIEISKYPFLRLNGNTFSGADGLISNIDNYTGRYVSLVLGNVSKENDFQVSLSLSVQGHKNSYNLRFVNGPLDLEGWNKDNYYEKINSHSSRLIDLAQIIKAHGDEYISTKEMVMIIESNSKLNTFEFIVSLGKVTENTPGKLSRGDKYFVKGIATYYGYTSEGVKYLFRDLALWQTVSLNFVDVPVPSWIFANDWEITDRIDRRSSLNPTGDILVKAEQKLFFNDISPSRFLNLDIRSSITNLGPKDYLFLVILVTLLCCLAVPANYFRNLGWRLLKQ